MCSKTVGYQQYLVKIACDLIKAKLVVAKEGRIQPG